MKNVFVNTKINFIRKSRLWNNHYKLVGRAIYFFNLSVISGGFESSPAAEFDPGELKKFQMKNVRKYHLSITL